MENIANARGRPLSHYEQNSYEDNANGKVLGKNIRNRNHSGDVARISTRTRKKTAKRWLAKKAQLAKKNQNEESSLAPWLPDLQNTLGEMMDWDKLYPRIVACHAA